MGSGRCRQERLILFLPGKSHRIESRFTPDASAGVGGSYFLCDFFGHSGPEPYPPAPRSVFQDAVERIEFLYIECWAPTAHDDLACHRATRLPPQR
jgi:hypothetical protein